MKLNIKFTHLSSMSIVALLILFNCALLYWNQATNTNKLDFFTLWAIPQVSNYKDINIYSHEGQKKIADYFINKPGSERMEQITKQTVVLYKGRIDAIATPALYTAFAFLFSSDFNTARMEFIIYSSVCFTLSIFIICYLVNFSFTASCLITALLSSFFPPVISDLYIGNLNQIQLFLLTLYIICAIKKNSLFIFLSGIILGFGILLKPNISLILVLTVILFLLDMKFKKLFFLLLGNIISAVFCFLISSLYFGCFSIWFDFIGSLHNTLNFSNPSKTINYGNFSFSKLFFYFTNINVSFTTLVIAITAFFLTVLFMKKINTTYVRQKAIIETFTIIGIGSAAMLMSASLAWMHYYVLLIPLMIFLIRPLPKHNTENTKNLIFIKLLAFLSLFIFLSFNGFIIELKPLSQCILVNISTVLLIILAYYEFYRGRKFIEALEQKKDTEKY